ncbi:MAG TPA: ATP-binding protein [Solirubrobacterales bacterium]|jgi:anti-sigma regulatory factor (Ser/Thr protein kinase)|nr:ATP-binding protein [Solirubrobacterales bacterium]
MVVTEPLRLRLDAEPASVGRARAAVAEVGAELGMDSPALDDLRTVVSEACSNVVRHAYQDGGGDFEIEATPSPAELEIVVRDCGEGLSPSLRSESAGLGLGLGLISTLSSHFEIRGRREGGTEVLIVLPLH